MQEHLVLGHGLQVTDHDARVVAGGLDPGWGWGVNGEAGGVAGAGVGMGGDRRVITSISLDKISFRCSLSLNLRSAMFFSNSRFETSATSSLQLFSR